MTFTLDTEYVAVSCGHESHGPADFPFAMTRAFYDRTKREGLGWYCPLGHPRVWLGETTEQELQRAKASETALRDQLSAAIRDAEETRAALLRDRHRFANGVCPCCTRTFENVRRHMTTQHPEYDVTPVAGKPPRARCSCGRSFETPRGLRIHQARVRHDDWDAPNQSHWRAHLTRI